MVSIVIRTFNEAKNLSKLIKILNKQTIDHEIIVVDSGSNDKTLVIAKKNNCKILICKPFTYGKALNIGIKKAKHKYVCLLSAHCFPTSNKYLENMLNDFDHHMIAGVYSKQLPTKNANILDKRNLSIIFRNEKLYQRKDSFFNNASSMIRKDIWKMIKFDEKLNAFEDIDWSMQVQKMNYTIVYEPLSAVYHYHNEDEYKTITRYENEWSSYKEIIKNSRVVNSNRNELIKNLSILVIIPAKADSRILSKTSKKYSKLKKSYLEITIDYAKKSKYSSEIVVSSEDTKVLSIAVRNNVKGLIRPKSLIGDAEVVDVYLHVVNNIDTNNFDYVVCLQPDFPKRSISLDSCLDYMVKNYYDDLITIDKSNERSGSIRIFKYKHLLSGNISKRIGCISDSAEDIHYKKSLLEIKNIS